MTSDEKFKLALTWTLEQMEGEEDEEVLERLGWFYWEIYNTWQSYKSPLLLSPN